MFRRRSLLAMAVALAAMPTAAQTPVILYVSREQVLREITAGRRLQEAEEALTAELQAKVDSTKKALNDEERELARLRNEMDRAEFATRVAAFDARVRAARQATQESAATLQAAFQKARENLVRALPAVIEQVRVEMGADMVLSANSVLAADPAADITARVIARFEATVPMPEIPRIDSAALFDLPEAQGR